MLSIITRDLMTLLLNSIIQDVPCERRSNGFLKLKSNEVNRSYPHELTGFIGCNLSAKIEK